jgi:S-adenosylhomocysteine hydrolase
MLSVTACGVAALAVLTVVAGYGAVGSGLAVLASVIAAAGAVVR